jgi:YidC/Oxa1 family membrane protein insertase
VKLHKWILLAALVISMLVLSGCGVPYEGVDVRATPPDGIWQTIAVWPLAQALISLNNFLEDANVPFHWGFAIILFTIIVKIVTFPLTLSQIRGMQAQKNLQPKIQELQKKYGKDREAMAKEQMKLYQEAGVNPLSGCLPLVIQMPILFALYAALVAIGPTYFKNANFFWINDLGFPKTSDGTGWLMTAFSEGDYLKLVSYLILPILLVATQFIMQKWMTTATPSSNDSQAQMMQQVSLMMTFMFGFFTLTVPSGLTLYWVVSNLLQMLQQWVITNERFNLTGAKTTAATESKAKPVNVSTSAAAESALPTLSGNGNKSLDPAPQQAKRRKPTKQKGK